MDAIRVLIVDDHAMVAEGLRDALAPQDGIEVVGRAATAEEAVAAARDLRPDVVVMDYRLPDADGVSAARRIRAARRNTAVVMVTASDHETVVASALKAGCVGYVTKDRAGSEVVAAVRAAARGEMIYPVEVLARLVPGAGEEESARPTGLTPRELEVLQLLAQGRSTSDVAAELGVSPNTVRNHVQSILRKLGAHSKLEAVNIALQQGLVSYPR